MNRIFTLILACASTLFCNAQSIFEQCQSGVTPSSLPQFKGQPTLIAGNALKVGAKYRYDYAVTEPYDMYAVIEIEEIVNAKVVKIDEADPSNLDKDGRFQPQIKPDVSKFTANREGYVQFSIHFYQASTNEPSNISGLRFTHYDMDGTGYSQNSWFRETSQITGQTEAQVSTYPASQLQNAGTVVSNGLTWTKFLGSTTEHGGVSSDPEVAMIATYGPTSTIKFRMGYQFKYSGSSRTAPDFRQYAAKFGCFSFINAAPLPVKLTYFGASAKSNHTVYTSWVTEQEINHDYFELERSFNNKDFSTVAMILGAKSSNGVSNNYDYTDKSAELKNQSIAYYRLKQVDKDGRITYSEVRLVKFASGNDVKVQVSPNPFIEKVTLQFDSEVAGAMNVRIVNLAGQVVLQTSARVNKGYNNVSLSQLSSLTPGMYIVQMMIDGKVMAKEKLVKE